MVITRRTRTLGRARAWRARAFDRARRRRARTFGRAWTSGISVDLVEVEFFGHFELERLHRLLEEEAVKLIEKMLELELEVLGQLVEVELLGDRDELELDAQASWRTSTGRTARTDWGATGRVRRFVAVFLQFSGDQLFSRWAVNGFSTEDGTNWRAFRVIQRRHRCLDDVIFGSSTATAHGTGKVVVACWCSALFWLLASYIAVTDTTAAAASIFAAIIITAVVISSSAESIGELFFDSDVFLFGKDLGCSQG